jgi:hypothetical protein
MREPTADPDDGVGSEEEVCPALSTASTIFV